MKPLVIALSIALAGCTAIIPKGDKAGPWEAYQPTFEERWAPVEELESGIDLTIHRDRADKVFFCQRHRCNVA